MQRTLLQSIVDKRATLVRVMHANPGPRPLTPPPILSAPRQRVLRATLELDGADVTINQVAEHLGGHPNSARQHLDALVTQRLLTAADVQSGRPGRRPRGYSLTAPGRQELGTKHVDETCELAGVFASYMVANGSGIEEARGIGNAWGDLRAGELTEEQTQRPLDAVVEVLDILGFDPAAIQTTEGEAVILRTCPLLDLAHNSPDFNCNIHHGLIDGVLRRIGAREGVELLPFSDPDGCRLKLTAPPEQDGEKPCAS